VLRRVVTSQPGREMTHTPVRRSPAELGGNRHPPKYNREPSRDACSVVRLFAPHRRESEGFDGLSSPAAWPRVATRFLAHRSPGGGGCSRCGGSAGLAQGALAEAGAVRPAARGVRRKTRRLSITSSVRRWPLRQVGDGLDTAARGDTEDLAQA